MTDDYALNENSAYKYKKYQNTRKGKHITRELRIILTRYDLKLADVPNLDKTHSYLEVAEEEVETWDNWSHDLKQLVSSTLQEIFISGQQRLLNIV